MTTIGILGAGSLGLSVAQFVGKVVMDTINYYPDRDDIIDELARQRRHDQRATAAPPT